MAVGIHQSFVGLSNAVIEAEACGLDTFQIFMRNNRNLKARTFTTDDYAMFNTCMQKSYIKSYVVHAPYAMNPASGDEDILKRTRELIVADMYMLSHMIGDKHYVLHPGAYTEYDAQSAMQTLIDTVHYVAPYCGGTKIAIEIMAGQGTQLIRNLEQLGWLLQACDDVSNFEVCVDTCHVFGAGMDMKHVTGLFNLLSDYDHIGVIHVNDSLCDFGSLKDRHANIGKGKIPVEVLKEQVCDLHRLNPTAPIILETPTDSIYYDVALISTWVV